MTRTDALRRFWPVPVIAVIAAVTAGVLVWGGHRDEQTRAAAGQAFDAAFRFDESIEVSNRTLRVPDGELDLTTTEPLPSAPSALNVPDRLAPAGGRFVGVQVSTAAARRLPLPVPRVDDYEAAAVSVALVVDGRTYPVPPTFSRTAQSRPADRLAWVAVSGPARTIAVAVGYDGVSQRIDMRTGTRTSGVADPLYRLNPGYNTVRPVECDAPAAVSGGFRIDADRGIECAVRFLGGLPYLPGKGWAPRGKVWYTALVGLERLTPRFQRGDESYRATIGGEPAALTASAGGVAAADETLPLSDDSAVTGGQGYLAAFALPVSSTPLITFTATYRDLVRTGVETARPVAAGPGVRVTWSLQS